MITSDSTAFPLGYLLTEAERARINGIYKEFLRAGAVFDERMSLRDNGGVARAVRVICVTRPPIGNSVAPVVGTIAAAKSAPARPIEATADLLARLPVLVWLVDAQGRVVHAQSTDPQTLGYAHRNAAAPAMGRGIRVQERVSRSDAKCAAEVARWHARIRRRQRPHQPLGRPLGTAQPLRALHQPRSKQEAAGGAGARHDCVARELIELDRLKRSKSQYKSLVEASANLIWACNHEFMITFVSRRATREIYGYETRELLGRSIDVLLPTDIDQPAVAAAFEALREGKPIRDLEAVHMTQGGRRLIMSISAAPLKRPDGTFAGVIGMNADLTALKSRERRLSEALRVERTVLDSAGQAIAVVKSGHRAALQ